jgi:hypothetical protein
MPSRGQEHHPDQAEDQPKHPGDGHPPNAEGMGYEQGEQRRGRAQGASQASADPLLLQENSRYGATLASAAMPAREIHIQGAWGNDRRPDNHTTTVGNLVEDPEVRFTNNGIAVTNLRVGVTQRIQQDGQWHDGDTSFFKVNVWRDQAEHLADSLGKGDRVMVARAGRSEADRG